MSAQGDTTPPEVRAMVDRTVELLKRQVGAVRTVRRHHSVPSSVQERLELIRRQAEAVRLPGGQ